MWVSEKKNENENEKVVNIYMRVFWCVYMCELYVCVRNQGMAVPVAKDREARAKL